MRHTFLLAPLLALGCQTAVDVQGTQQPIIRGSEDTIATHDAVVALTDNSGFSFCTGTFVGLRTIVTAAHCLEFGGPDKVYFGQRADEDGFNCGVTPACGFFDVVAFDDPGFNGNTFVNDFGVVRINQDPTLNGKLVTPMPFTRFSDGTNLSAADEGAQVSFSGFGITNGNTGAGGGEKLVVDGITLSAVGPDAASDIDANQVFYLQPSTIGGPCSGDSGGPMFIVRDGVEYLAGVTSFGDFACVIDGVSTRVDQFEAFIEGFCGAANCGQGAPSCNNNGAIDPGEACDGANLDGQSCATIGFDAGALSCNASCGFDDSACVKQNTTPESCTNGQDDDGDGLADCADPDCAQALACQPDEICDDGADNDDDGNADCDDSECKTDPFCIEQEKGCATTPASQRTAPVAILALFALSLLSLRRPRKSPK